ncbi:hypothetical protein L218DRAFT_886691, partial [Marasmius fiardii PR-910]
WVGVEYGTVELVMYRVMLACLNNQRCAATAYRPNNKQKENAKWWTEARSCTEWRNGYLGVDGTLCPVGNSWYDRKSNYFK